MHRTEIDLRHDQPWPHSRRERDTRYYELRVQQDLWGQWLLTRVWGRKGSALGQMRHTLCVDQADAHACYAKAVVRRAKRGYQVRRPANN